MRSVDGGVQFTDSTGDARHFLTRHPSRTSTRSRSRRAGSRSSPPTAALTRTSGSYVDFSSDCDTRNLTGCQPAGLPHVAVRDPGSDHRDELRAGRCQFQDTGGRPERPDDDMIGGTQDNGSPTSGTARLAAWTSSATAHRRASTWTASRTTTSTPASRIQVNLGRIDPDAGTGCGSATRCASRVRARRSSTARDRRPGRQPDRVLRDCGTSGARRTAAVRRRHSCRATATDSSGTAPAPGRTPAAAISSRSAARAGDLAPARTPTRAAAAGFVVRRGTGASTRHDVGRHPPRPRCSSRRTRAAEPAAVTYTRLDTPAQPRAFSSGISVDPNGQVPRDRVLHRLRGLHARASPATCSTSASIRRPGRRRRPT